MRFLVPFLILAGELVAWLFGTEWDLQARWFGILVAAVLGLFPELLCRFRLVGKSAWKQTFLVGYLAGGVCDALYFLAFGKGMGAVVCASWCTLLGLGVVFGRKSRESRCEIPCRSVTFIVSVTISILTAGVTVWCALPELQPEPRVPEEGIYVYANDVVYNLPVLNILSSRAGVTVHTGICFLTHDPVRVNQRRQTQGFPLLYFEKLDGDFWINDLNLDVRDRDGFTNYGSRTRLDDRSFPFDLEHWNYYLAGRSVNDRVRPAIRVKQLETTDPETVWNELTTFRDLMNVKYPAGFIYSPLPYTGNFVRLYNCNTMTVALAEAFLKRGKEAETLTNLPFSLGGQSVADGRLLMQDWYSEDFQERMNLEREFMRSEPARKQKLLHRLLNKQ